MSMTELFTGFKLSILLYKLYTEEFFAFQPVFGNFVQNCQQKLLELFGNGL